MSFVVPVESDADVSCSRPVGCDFVVVFEFFLEVQSVFFADIFDPKIVHHERELNWACIMLPESRYVLALPIAMLVESFSEEFIC